MSGAAGSVQGESPPNEALRLAGAQILFRIAFGSGGILALQVTDMKLCSAVLFVAMVLTTACSAGAADAVTSETLGYWNYPGSATQIKAVGDGEGQCVQETPDSFRAVVKYYCDRAGFVPPNWNILGREFPGDTICMPGFWADTGKLATGEAPRVGVTHNIRPDAAQATFLVRLVGESDSICVSISRGKSESTTTIHILTNTKR